MDPLSAVACVAGLADVALRTVSALVEYTRTTQNASADKAILADEASSLSKSLERLRDRAQREDSGLDETWLDERKDLVRQFTRAHEDLAKLLKFDVETGQLKQESRLKAIRTLAKWSFTKGEVYSLLERINRLQQYSNTLLLDDQYSIVKRIDQRQDEVMDTELRQAILKWLSPLQMAQIHQTISSRVQDGSGRWFTTSDSFLRWEAGKDRLLWCSGIPGAGKTVIASIAINHLGRKRALNKSEPTIGIAFIYFKYNDPTQTLENILGSLLKQLSRDQKIIPAAVKDRYDYHRERNTSLSLDESMESLMCLAKLYSKLFIIIDALDECSDEVRWGLVDKLRQCQPPLHLMITSRFLDSIDKELEEFERFDIKANKADLELFIDHQISQNKNLRRLIEKSPAMRADIKATVVKTSEDMFLLAQLHVQSLATAAALSVSHVRKKLQTLPTTLDGTYDEAMRRITAQEPEYQDIALKTLAWVSYAFRSLSLGELQHALAIEPGNTQLDAELLMDGYNITSLCAGLVVIDPATNIVNLVHYTTKMYFENIRLVRFPGFHATITMSCATYLALEELKDASIWQIVQHYPLACYAAQYMGDHARQNPEDALEPPILQNICRLLSNPDKRKPLLSLLDSLDLIKAGFHSVMREAKNEDANLVHTQSSTETSHESATLSVRKRSETTDLGGKEIIANSSGATRNLSESWEDPARTTHVPEVTALHLAASMGLAKVASMLLSEVPDVDALDETGKTALAVAMERGFERAVEFLVKSGASVDLGSEHGRGVFLLINESDWHKVADTVASKAQSVTSFTSSNAIQLVLAAYHGDRVEIQRLISQEKIDLGGKFCTVGASALFIAVERNHPHIVHALLDAGVSVNSTDSRGQTSLHRATRRENEAMLRLLLQNGAEADHKNDDGRTPWSSNLRSGNRHILRILLEAGADPNTKGHQGVSELYEGATHGETDLVELMLESGTNPSIKTQFRWAPLHWAAYYGHTACVKLLLRYGAELSPISDQDATPLDLALRANQIVIVDILTRAGAKENRDVETLTPSPGLKKTITFDDWSAPLPDAEDGTVRVKLSLIFDKPITQGLDVGQFIYPSTVRAPKDYIYHISHLLETSTKVLTIRSAQHRADMVEYPLHPDQFPYDDALYDIVRLTSEYQQLELHPKKQSSLPGTIHMHRDWTGSWKAHHIQGSSTKYLFRTTPDWSKLKDEGCRWMTEDGILLARTGFEAATPTVTLEPGPERQMQDILITCWVAKLWAETVAIQRRVGEGP